MGNRTKRKSPGLDFSRAMAKRVTNRYNPNDPRWDDVHRPSSFMNNLVPHSRRPDIPSFAFLAGMYCLVSGTAKRRGRNWRGGL